MSEKKALTRETAKLYQKSQKHQKTEILDHFVSITGYHRKYALTLLGSWGKEIIKTINGKPVKIVAGALHKRKKRQQACIYDASFCACLKRIWEFFDYMCGKRLAYLIRNNIDALVQYNSFGITREIKAKLVRVSSSTIDRKMTFERTKLGHKARYNGRTAGYLKYKIPVRVSFGFHERLPGFFEFDTVFHDGGNLRGEFCKTLTATDVCLGWTILTPLRNSAHRWVKEAAENLKQTLPYTLLGIDSDNGPEFINTQLYDWCNANGITFTRSRSYHKNDNCFVEQKNDYAVRRFVGYARYDTEGEFLALKEVYAHLNLLLNYFYPTQKIISKTRLGARVLKTYEPCKTPYERLLESPTIPQAYKQLAIKQREQLSIIELKENLDQAIAKLISIHKTKRNFA